MTLSDIAIWDDLTSENAQNIFPSTSDKLSIILSNGVASGDWVSNSGVHPSDKCVIQNRHHIQQLEGVGYNVVEDLDTWDFIVRHEVIANRLLQAIGPLNKAMGGSVSPRVRGDRDEDGCQLLILVPPYPENDIQGSLRRLNTFSDGWWSENMDEFGLTVLISIG